jgi:hypothetical protein
MSAVFFMRENNADFGPVLNPHRAVDFCPLSRVVLQTIPE